MAEKDKQRQPPESEPGFRWLDSPAIFCDTYYADYFPSSGVVRISFGEYTNRDYLPYFRTSVALPLSDAKSLRRTLDRLIKEAETPAEEAAKITPAEVEDEPSSAS